MKKDIHDDTPISIMSLAFYCKQDGVSAKKYFLSINSPFPFSVAKNNFPAGDPAGLLTQLITLIYQSEDPTHSAGPHEILLGTYSIPPNPGVGQSLDCPINGSVGKVLGIAEVKQGTTTRPPDKPYDNAQHKG